MCRGQERVSLKLSSLKFCLFAPTYLHCHICHFFGREQVPGFDRYPLSLTIGKVCPLLLPPVAFWNTHVPGDCGTVQSAAQLAHNNIPILLFTVIYYLTSTILKICSSKLVKTSSFYMQDRLAVIHVLSALYLFLTTPNI